MKKLSKYIFTLAALALASTACVKEEEYQKGQSDLEGCYGVYFPVQETKFVVDPDSDPVQTLTAVRTNVDGDITVPVVLSTSADGVLELSPIEFVDGQAETTFTVSYPKAEIGTKYTMSLTIEDPLYASNYLDGATSLDISVLRERWISLGKAQYLDDWFGMFIGIPIVGETEILQNELNPNKFRIIDPFTPFWNSHQYTPKDAPDPYFEIEVLKVGQVLWPGQEYETKITLSNLIMYDPICTGYYDNTNGGTHHYYHPCNFGATEAESAWTYNCVLGYQDNGLPTAFQIAPFPYMPGVGGWNYSTVPLVTIVFPGAVLVDYSFSVEADYCVNGVTPLWFDLGVDIETVKYAVAAGKLGLSAANELLEGVKNGTAENLHTITADEIILDEEESVKYAGVGLSFEESGEYTVVAVGFDAEGNAQASETVVFDYVAATDHSYDVNYTVEVSDTPSRFAENYNSSNSFSFLIYGGKDLTDLKLGVYKTSDVETYGVDAVVADLRSGDSVSEETLALANSLYGYSDIMGGLKEDTSYTFVVWATNGMQTKVFTEIYVTEPNPEVFKSLGMATYTDALVGAWFQAPAVTYNVEIQESVDNPGKYRLVNPYGEAYPYNEPGDWDADNTYYLTIDATNPDAVNIVSDYLGVDWGYGMMWVMSAADYFLLKGEATQDQLLAAGYYGKLVDGVITFAAQTILIGDDGDQLGAGTFQVILPSASTDTPAEEGTVTASVSKASKLTANSIEYRMIKGRVANLNIEPEVRTVNCVVSEVPVASHQSNKRTAELKAFELR